MAQIISHFPFCIVPEDCNFRDGAAILGIDYRNNAELYEDHAHRVNYDKVADGWDMEIDMWILRVGVGGYCLVT
jgi:hypothetical protein